jgi:rhodanese-related sulfurtransferase
MGLKEVNSAAIAGICSVFLPFSRPGSRPTLGRQSHRSETHFPSRDANNPCWETMDLATGVDRFLTSMPAGYYTIANVEGLKKQLKKTQTLLVDVREPSEYRSGHIPNAINIPLRTLTQNLDQIARDRPVVLYCSSGYRSAMGVMTLHLLGYENVQGFPPSFAGWKNAGEAIS